MSAPFHSAGEKHVVRHCPGHAKAGGSAEWGKDMAPERAGQRQQGSRRPIVSVATAVAVGVAVLTACGSSAAPHRAPPSVRAGEPSSTASPTTVMSPQDSTGPVARRPAAEPLPSTTKPSPGQSPPTAPTALTNAAHSAVASCTDSRSAGLQQASARTGLLRRAADEAAAAAALDVSWKQLAADDDFIAELPPSGNAPPVIAQAQSAQREIQSICAAAGVTIPG